MVVDEYTASYNEISGWLDVGESPYALVNELPIISVGSLTGQNLMIGIAEDDIDLKDTVLETFESIYPGITIEVVTIGETTWSTGSSICISKTDDCSPQLGGIKAIGLNSTNASAESFTVTMGYETEDGEKGFLAPKHAFGLDDTGNAVYRTVNGTTPIDKHGKVLTNSGLNSAGNLNSDTVFVEFDKEQTCAYIHPNTGVCLAPREGDYIETVEPLTIFSEDNTKYTVTDSTRKYFRNAVLESTAINNGYATVINCS